MEDFSPPPAQSLEPRQISLAALYSPAPIDLLAAAKGVGELVVSIAAAVENFVQMLRNAWHKAERAHHREALLQAYQRRHDWRKADVPKLRALGVNRAAQKRIAAIECKSGRGRGVVKRYRPLDDFLLDGAMGYVAMLSPDTKPKERLTLLKKSKVWPYVVFALHRHQYGQTKQAGTPSPAEEAEHVVGEFTGISAAQVRKLCLKAKRSASAHGGFFWKTLARESFEHWKATGELKGDADPITIDADVEPDIVPSESTLQ
jgi:hypothetical protein